MLEKHKFYHLSCTHLFGFPCWCSYRGIWSLSSYLDHSVPVPNTFHDAAWNKIAFRVCLLKTTNSRKHQSFSASDIRVTRAKGGRLSKDQEADPGEKLKRGSKEWTTKSRSKQTMYCIVVGDVFGSCLCSWLLTMLLTCYHGPGQEDTEPRVQYPGHSQACVSAWHLLTSLHASSHKDQGRDAAL